MKTSVIGCGRWGSFIAWYLDKIGHEIALYGRETSEKFNILKKTRTNGMVTLGEKVNFTSDLEAALGADVIFISIPSQNLRMLCGEIAKYKPFGKIFVLNMKGLEISTGKRLSEVAGEFLGKDNKIAIWVGPGHPQEFVKGVPNCMVIDSRDEETKKYIVDKLSSRIIRLYYGDDLIGNEIGAATKNVIGIAAGMLDGMGISSLKGALMSRAPREISRLTVALGGNENSPYGLCHLGDYEATVFSQYSHNRMFGEMFVKGEKFDELAEGYYTAKAVYELSLKYDVDMPICKGVYKTLYCGVEPNAALYEMFSRSIKKEFY